MDAVKDVEPLTGLKIPHTRLIDPEGKAVEPLSGFAQDPDALKMLYCAMVRARTFDQKAVSLQRTGLAAAPGRSGHSPG